MHVFRRARRWQGTLALVEGGPRGTKVSVAQLAAVSSGQRRPRFVVLTCLLRNRCHLWRRFRSYLRAVHVTVQPGVLFVRLAAALAACIDIDRLRQIAWHHLPGTTVHTATTTILR